MAGYNFPMADFTPQLAGYTGQGAFRFWCQKVLPIVYDDSLSYYELLNKVVVYLNNVIKDMQTAGENIDELLEAYVKLQDFVNSYWDFEPVIKEKLDEMAKDGTLGKIVYPWIEPAVKEWLDEHPDATTTVEDGSISKEKLALNNTVRYVTVDCLHRAACNFFVWPNGDVFIVDFGDETSADLVVDSITRNGGIRLCGVMLTHAHHDHVGDFANVVNKFLWTDDFKAFVSDAPTEWPGWADPNMAPILYDYQTFCNYFRMRDKLEIVNESTEFSVNGSKFTFYNYDVLRYYQVDGKWIPISGSDFNYNNTSLCVNVALGFCNVSNFGDIFNKAQQNIVSDGALIKADIAMAPHHGTSTIVNKGFITKLMPDCLIANVGSQSDATGTMGFNSAIMEYCNERDVPLLDTVNGDVIIDISYDGTYKTDSRPEYYNYILRDYAGLRSATNIGDGVNNLSASAYVEDILTAMPKNSRITCFITSGYGLAKSFGITTSMSNIDRIFASIVKFTSGSTNNLMDRREDPNLGGSYYFLIEFTFLDNRGFLKTERVPGRHRVTKVNPVPPDTEPTYTERWDFYTDDSFNKCVVTINANSMTFTTKSNAFRQATMEEAYPQTEGGNKELSPKHIAHVRPGIIKVKAVNGSDEAVKVNLLGVNVWLGSNRNFRQSINEFIVQTRTVNDQQEQYIEADIRPPVVDLFLSRGVGVSEVSTTSNNNVTVVLEEMVTFSPIKYIPKDEIPVG